MQAIPLAIVEKFICNSKPANTVGFIKKNNIMNIILGVYSVFGSAAIIYVFWHLFLKKDTNKIIIDSIRELPDPADQLTPKEKKELSDYISEIKGESKPLDISAFDTLTDSVIEAAEEPVKVEIPKPAKEPILLPEAKGLGTYEPLKKAILSHSLPLPQSKIQKVEKKPIVEPKEQAIPEPVLPKKNFQKEASKHGIKKFVFNCDGKSIAFTPEKISRYEDIDYTMAGIEIYLQTQISTVIYAVKYSDYFIVFLGNGEEVKIPTKVCKINSCDMLTIPDFEY
jgi:hypothetical protein